MQVESKLQGSWEGVHEGDMEEYLALDRGEIALGLAAQGQRQPDMPQTRVALHVEPVNIHIMSDMMIEKTITRSKNGLYL